MTCHSERSEKSQKPRKEGFLTSRTSDAMRNPDFSTNLLVALDHAHRTENGLAPCRQRGPSLVQVVAERQMTGFGAAARGICGIWRARCRSCGNAHPTAGAKIFVRAVH